MCRLRTETSDYVITISKSADTADVHVVHAVRNNGGVPDIDLKAYCYSYDTALELHDYLNEDWREM